MTFPQDTQRDRMRAYFRDMSVSIAISTHKDALRQAEIPERIVAEVAHLAVEIAMQKYDAEGDSGVEFIGDVS